ncbi:hydantoinase/oxoprolinase N-terminal domain-containing protein [Nonomuraea sp. B1E8]|uniref:hydantoinase/oxoprolinase N-terminal domain-containing protein n=1 Tax=unclassified Nonomuraea TaxID=2593643 RepID=UPI00325ED2FC
MGFVIGVDAGGTFTDVVLRAKETRRGTLAVAKVLSTHYDPIAGILAGVTRALGDRDPARVERVVHATTLATNAVLERTGVRVAYVTTQGFRATIPLGRYARVEEDRYDPGRDGGLPGPLGGFFRRRLDGTVERLASKVGNVRFAAGEAFIVETTGGGGIGPPGERDREAILADLEAGRVTPRGAAEDYGVSL